MVGTCGIIVSTARGVGERIVGVVYYLEFLGPFSAFWGVGGYTVGMCPQSFPGSFVSFTFWRGPLRDVLLICIADLLLSSRGGYSQGSVCGEEEGLVDIFLE